MFNYPTCFHILYRPVDFAGLVLLLEKVNRKVAFLMELCKEREELL
jgi:hypothetical protein